MIYEYFICETYAFFKRLFIQCRKHFLLVKIIDHQETVHIAHQFISCHRTSADAIQRTIKTPAAGTESRFQFFNTIFPPRMQVNTGFYLRKCFDQ